MRNTNLKTVTVLFLAVLLPADIAAAQAPAAGGAQAAAPSYVSIILQADVNKPAADVWKRIGKYCDISEWLSLQCTISAGKDGEVGAVRSLGAIGTEILVGKTDLSYTYTQPARPGHVRSGAGTASRTRRRGRAIEEHDRLGVAAMLSADAELRGRGASGSVSAWRRGGRR